MTYKQAFKFVGIITGVFFIVVFAMLAIGISNEVYYKELEVEERAESYTVRVETEATEEKELRWIVEDVKKEYKDKDVVFLFIFNKNERLAIATARIALTTKGEIMAEGATKKEYYFEMK